MSDISDLLLNRFLQGRPTSDDQKPQALVVDERSRRVAEYSEDFRLEFGTLDPLHFPHLEYTKAEPRDARAGPSLLDRSNRVVLTGDSGDVVTSSGGIATCRANVCVRSGEWYFEVRVLHRDVQCGISRRESSCDAPLGYNVFSYGVHAPTGEFLHYGFRFAGCRPLQPGDVVGFHLRVPGPGIADDFVRTRVPFKYRNTVMLESVDYAVGVTDDYDVRTRRLLDPVPEKTIAGSFCRVSVNGEWQPLALAEPLRDFGLPHSKLAFELDAVDDGSVGYYPTITAFEQGAARFEFGPAFASACPPTARPLCERFEEMIAEDVARDTLYETCFEIIDELVPPEFQGRPPLRSFD